MPGRLFGRPQGRQINLTFAMPCHHFIADGSVAQFASKIQTAEHCQENAGEHNILT